MNEQLPSDDIDARDRFGQTKLFHAAEKGDFDLVKELVAKGSDVSLVDNQRVSASKAARMAGHTAIAEFLNGIEQERGLSAEALAEKARVAFEGSQAVRTMQARKEAELAEAERRRRQQAEEEKAVWFYSKDLEKREGPISLSSLRRLLDRGAISADTLVWGPSLDDWKPAGEVIGSAEARNRREQDHATPTTSQVQTTQGNEQSSQGRDKPSADQEEVSAGPRGVGGWLLLLVVGMMILGPLLGSAHLIAGFSSTEEQYPVLKAAADWQTYKTVTWIAFAVVAAISFYGGWGLANGKNRSVVRRAKAIQWIVGPIAAIVVLLLIPLATLGYTGLDDPQVVVGFFGSIIQASIWTAYLAKSKRVRNTYGEGDG